MMKKYLMNGLAILGLGLVVASCSKETDFSNADALKHAEDVLGVTIDPNQDWKMTNTATANVSVNKNFGETYTVKVYANNPMVGDVATVLAKGKVKSGGKFSKAFDYASALNYLYVGLTDKKGFTIFKKVAVTNGEVNVSFIDNEDSSAPRRSQLAPACPDILTPYKTSWVTEYLTTATEPNSTNVYDNYDNTTYATNWSVVNAIPWDGSDEDLLRQWFTQNKDNLSWDELVAWALANRPNWISYNQDETYVRNFKITGTWNGGINVAGSEGLTDEGTRTNAERTIVVTGTWNITENQRIGSLGKIIIANGGTVNVSSGVTLNMVNQARLVVLAGGTLTGEGSVEVNNGNAEGLENYNGGTISVAVFNNNFGKFYNYGFFYVNEYQGGAKESNFYNHYITRIDHFAGTGSTANARIFNECQFYVIHNARIRNYEGLSGSSLIVDGELMFSTSEDETSDPTYVGLAAGALVQCGTLYNNGTSWSGPRSNGYAVLSTGKITYLNWEQDAPWDGGYFENNIYIHSDVWDNVPDGNGYHQTDSSDEANYALSTAEYKMFDILANCTTTGNNGVTKIVKDDNGEAIISASYQFEKGSNGCTPGFKAKGGGGDDTNQVYSYAFEDSWRADYDMNDVVVKIQENASNPDQIDITLCCTGAAYNLYVFLGNEQLFGGREVHAALAGNAGKFINTGDASSEKFETRDPITITGINKPKDASGNNVTLGKLDIWIKSPEKDIHVAEPGEDPHGVVIPIDWRWPKEWTSVKEAYPKFIEFAKDQSQNTDWYKDPVLSKVY